MGTVTVATDLMNVLKDLTQQTELYDTHGNLVGVFTPNCEAEAFLESEARQIFDLEEAKRRLATEKPGRTTKEVLKRLMSAEPSQ